MLARILRASMKQALHGYLGRCTSSIELFQSFMYMPWYKRKQRKNLNQFKISFPRECRLKERLLIITLIEFKVR